MRAQEKIDSSKMPPPAGALVIWWVVVNNEAEDALREVRARSTTTYYAENFVKAALDLLAAGMTRRSG